MVSPLVFHSKDFAWEIDAYFRKILFFMDEINIAYGHIEVDRQCGAIGHGRVGVIGDQPGAACVDVADRSLIIDDGIQASRDDDRDVADASFDFH